MLMSRYHNNPHDTQQTTINLSLLHCFIPLLYTSDNLPIIYLLKSAWLSLLWRLTHSLQHQLSLAWWKASAELLWTIDNWLILIVTSWMLIKGRWSFYPRLTTYNPVSLCHCIIRLYCSFDRQVKFYSLLNSMITQPCYADFQSYFYLHIRFCIYVLLKHEQMGHTYLIKTRSGYSRVNSSFSFKRPFLLRVV